jgi:hypothetical protein
LMVVLVLAVLVIGVYWSPFADYSQKSARMLFENLSLALR